MKREIEQSLLEGIANQCRSFVEGEVKEFPLKRKLPRVTLEQMEKELAGEILFEMKGHTLFAKPRKVLSGVIDSQLVQ